MMGKWEKYGKNMGKVWEKYGKMGKIWEKYGNVVMLYSGMV